MRGRLGVLVSGNGSNLQALLDAWASGALAAEIGVVISSRKDAYALERARGAGIPALALPFSRRTDRVAYEQELLGHLLPYRLDLLVLAGWMFILSPGFLARCPWPILNVHPALLSADGGDRVTASGHTLPVLRGAHAVADALAHNLPFTGVTVHHVTARVDAGPVVRRELVPIEPGDTEESLYRRIKPVEHRLLLEAVQIVLSSPHAGVVHA